MTDFDIPESDEPRRWRDAPASAPVDAEIGAALKWVDERAELDELRLAQIRQQVLRSLPVRSAPARYRTRTMAVAIVALLAGSMATALGERLIRRLSGPAVTPVAPASPVADAPHRRARRLAAGDPVAPPAELAAAPAVVPPAPPLPATVEQVPALPPARPPARSSAAVRVPPAAASETPKAVVPELRENPVAVEAAAVADALRLVRQAGDPRGALARLDEHDRRFPDGPLAREALLARVEALLALDEHRAAVRLLDALPDGAFPGDGRLALLRGELRARQGRCAEAVADFDGALAGAPGPEVTARAQAARGRCLDPSSRQ